MSAVTNIMICSTFDDDKCEERMNIINTWLAKNHHTRLINAKYAKKMRVLPPDTWGGEKNPEVDVILGAFDMFDSDTFISFLKTLDWETGTDLFIMRQEEDRFTPIPLGEAREIALHRKV
jgi:hypothetical protein